LGPRTFLTGYNYDSERKLITVSPSVRFRVTPTAFLDIGYLAGIDRTENEKAPTFGATRGGFNHAGFVDLLMTS
jgi:hypothetical protein